MAEQVAVSLLYADYYKKSSFMVDKLNNYFLGGLDDMATVLREKKHINV